MIYKTLEFFISKAVLGPVCFCVSKVFLKKFANFLFFNLLQINFFFFVFLNHFDVLVSKIILKK
jgi:hypothetical protein